ncbi:tail assembly protein [Photorhabdus laumondii subsp. laumondii]|uniref:Tail assembly protein n=2 Tax=Morganellaceae TaxID=1903414 RepID=A0A6L9JPV8_PHOLM|nr:phage tail protein [Photorhabdus laumondii subsp. laumondii]RAW75975.1 phage tail protein [Photorhabdus sp. S7-51]RAW76466.1 phage tail protein [Photorhabdus sp. S14-60]RAW80471.1 phage tail protein [Photorhabdus sp. S15-56]RAW86653.1 phage tail protein [Photorhabdus sp. S12-55]RAW88063.1 phage tail protein [Photorhabdus sp. S5P8-50]
MAFIDVPMRTIRMHGPLIKRFGKEFKYKALDAKKAIDAMRCLLPGFEKYMIEAHKKGLTFAIFCGGKNISKDELDMTKGTEDIHILPVIIGSKRGGLFQTILGVALITAAAIASGGIAAAFTAGGMWGTTAMVGASMALGGVVQMLSPQMPGLRMRESPDNKPSYAFGGPVNTTAQGNPVSVLYGTREIGGAIISAGIYTEDQQ